MVLMLRNLDAEIEELSFKKTGIKHEKFEELQELKKHLDNIVPFQTKLKDYHNWVMRYNKLRKELLKDD